MTNIILTGEEYRKKKTTLNKVCSDPSGWLNYYTDADSNKWIEEYPNSEYHGGGSPQLRQVTVFPWEQFRKREYQFKKEYYQIKGFWNITGYIICAGHGYDLRTYCCKKCGELFAVNFESICGDENSIRALVNGKFCPNCGVKLNTTLVSYPEHIFHEGTLLENSNTIDRVNFKQTELKEVWSLD